MTDVACSYEHTRDSTWRQHLQYMYSIDRTCTAYFGVYCVLRTEECRPTASRIAIKYVWTMEYVYKFYNAQSARLRVRHLSYY